MNFKLDENLPVEVARLFAEAGHFASTAVEQGLGGASDQTIAERCATERLVLVTLDLGFADIGTYPPSNYAGLIVLRLKRQDRQTVASVVSRLIGLLAKEELFKRLWVVDESRIRIRE
jgi:predicted nuclease of predicted toxin-antitoxin system